MTSSRVWEHSTVVLTSVCSDHTIFIYHSTLVLAPVHSGCHPPEPQYSCSHFSSDQMISIYQCFCSHYIPVQPKWYPFMDHFVNAPSQWETTLHTQNDPCPVITMPLFSLQYSIDAIHLSPSSCSPCSCLLSSAVVISIPKWPRPPSHGTTTYRRGTYTWNETKRRTRTDTRAKTKMVSQFTRFHFILMIFFLFNWSFDMCE